MKWLWSLMAASNTRLMTTSRPLLRGIVFDMDGTLTEPNLDFAEMYRRCGVDPSLDILAELPKLPDPEKAANIIEEMEHEARQTLQLIKGALEIQEWCRHHEIPIALVTRNSKRTVQRLKEIGFGGLDLAISRDSGLPAKPDPAALHHIAAEWKLERPDETLVMVGDSLSNDIVFGKAAGVTTTLFDYSKRSQWEGKDIQPDMVVNCLLELPKKLWERFEIDSTITQNYGNKRPAPKPSTTQAQAAAEGNLELLRQFMDKLDTVDPETGNTPLIYAVDNGHTHIVEFLLEQKVNVNVRGFLGATAVSRAARRGHAALIPLLSKHGADLDIPNNKMQYPLHFAAFKQNKEAVQALLDCGANKYSLDRKGRTPDQDTSDADIAAMILNY